MNRADKFAWLAALGLLWTTSVSAENQPAAPLPAGAPAGLAWDAVVKEHHAKAGETTNLFAFSLTNCSTQELVIRAVNPSCGCTAVQLPPLPWTLAPGERGRIQAAMDWRGRFGLFVKTITVVTDAGSQVLTLKIQLPEPAGNLADQLTRARNLQLAATDRQAVFKHDCARCHAEPAVNKTGELLYHAACAICHDTPHRATMVPDLWALKHPTDRAFWRQWVTQGKAKSLMPAFAQQEGGPLTDRQIDSLVEYLELNLSRRTNAPATSVTGLPRHGR